MQAVKQIWRKDGEALVEVQAPVEIFDEMGLFHLHPALFDACLQGFWTTFDQADGNTYLPMNLERFSLLHPLPQKIWSHIILRDKEKDDSNSIIGDVQILDENHQVVARVEGLYFRAASGQMLQPRHEWDDWFYEVEWQLQSKQPNVPVVESDFLSTLELSSEIEAQVTILEKEHHIERYREMFPQLEKLSAGYIVVALRELGLHFRVGQRISSDVRSSLGILGALRQADLSNARYSH